MRHQLRILAAAIAAGAALGIAGCASPAATDAAATANVCINPARIQKQEILSDREIRFEMYTGEVWINTLKRDCSGLKFEGGFQWNVRGMQVCGNQQTITVLNAGNTCMLGAFTKAPAAPA